MSTTALEHSLSRDSVSFDEGPILVGCHHGAEPTDGVVHRGEEDEDDSLAMVFSADTGAGRAHTPQRLNRTNTPQRARSSSLLYTAAAPAQQAVCSRGRGDARRQPLGRRKQRRWENDNLLGVETFLRGRYAQEEGEAEHLTVSRPWRSSLSILVSDQNISGNAAEVRESVRKGIQPTRSDAEDSSKPGARRFAGGKWEDAEERFLLVERRLRDIVVRALRNPILLSFVTGLETLLDTFAEHEQVPTDMPVALYSALVARPTVESGQEIKSAGATLLVPLGPSPFHRLLLHALCQYRKLRSRSEETSDGRIVRVIIPTSRSIFAAPDASLAEFVLQTRLRENGGAEGGKGRFSQAPACAARCGQQEPRPVVSSAVGIA